MEMVFSYKEFIISFIAFLVLGSLGCRSTKNSTVNLPLKQRSQEEAVKALQSRYLPFKFMNIKASAEFEALGMGGSGSMNLRIKKDSLIWMQGKKLGIEGFRGVIKKDSFIMVNRIEGNYYCEPNEAISSMFGVNFEFEDLQELMAGNIIGFSDEEISAYQQIDDKCYLIINNAKYNIIYILDARSFLLSGIVLKDRAGNSAKAEFREYKQIPKSKQVTPYSRNYYFSSREGDQGKMEINISEVELNIEKSLIFNLPSHYDRLRL
jgi:hypothetical protein